MALFKVPLWVVFVEKVIPFIPIPAWIRALILAGIHLMRMVPKSERKAFKKEIVKKARDRDFKGVCSGVACAPDLKKE